MTLAFWGAIALLLAGALLFVLPPLFRPSSRTLEAGPSPLTVYREQRAQFDAELAAGVLTVEQHAKAVEELQDRVVDEVGELREPVVALSSRLPPFASVLALALIVPAGALGLYGLLGKPGALEPATSQAASGGGAPHTMTREQMEAMVERLAEKLKKSPQDADGWHMLARSYVAFGRLPEAARAYERAASLAPKDPQLLADYADTLAMVNGRSLEGRPLELVNQALNLDPNHPKALSLSGTAAFNRGDFAQAVAVWQKLKAMLPPDSDQVRSLSASIAQAQAGAANVSTAPSAATDPSRTAGDSPAPSTPAAQAVAASVEGSVMVADGLKPRVAPGTTLFVFARAVNGPRMPVAITRVPAGQFPFQFRLDDSVAMTPEFKLSGQAQVVLGARISRSGDATPQSGDLMGTLGPVAVGSRNLKLVIDGVVP